MYGNTKVQLEKLRPRKGHQAAKWHKPRSNSISVSFPSASYGSTASRKDGNAGDQVLRKTVSSFSYKFQLHLSPSRTHTSEIFASALTPKINSLEDIHAATKTIELRLSICSSDTPIDRTKEDVFLVLRTRIHLFLYTSNQHSRSGVGKLQPTGQTQSLLCKNLYGTQLHPDVYILSVAAFLLQRWACITATETVQPVEPKAFTTQPFRQFANSCFRCLNSKTH